MKWPFQKRPSLDEKAQSYLREVDISNDTSTIPESVILGLSSGIPEHISPREAYYMSERNGDLGGAVSMIASAVSGLTLAIEDKQKEKRQEDVFLKRLNSPGEGMRKNQFFYELAESMLLTNESWIVARGNVNKEPLALIPIRPYNLSVVMDFTDGIPQTITTQCYRDRRTYYREYIDGHYRFIDSIGMNEIFPIISVSNLTDEWRGRSRLIKLFYDVKMNTDGKRHNVSLLQNGMRVSSILMPDGTRGGGEPVSWTEQTVDVMTDRIRSFNQGSGNAGNNLIVSHQMKAEGLTQNNKDMDYLSLLGVSRETIYNEYRVPLPLILSEAMTLSNYTAAQRAFYDNAVFPVFDNLADGLLYSLGVRYKSIEDTDKLVFSDIDIRPMRNVLVENMELLKKTQAVSTNEIRSVGGYEPDPAGDSILVQSSNLPLEALDIGPTFEQLERENNIDTEPTENTGDAMESDSRAPVQADAESLIQ